MKKKFKNFNFQNWVKADEQKFLKIEKYVIFFQIFARQRIENLMFFMKKFAIFSNIFDNNI